jgi:hypothetical protein
MTSIIANDTSPSQLKRLNMNDLKGLVPLPTAYQLFNPEYSAKLAA